MRPCETSIDNQHILYDVERIANIAEFSFDPEVLRARKQLSGSAQGRGNTHFFNYDGQALVLRHYRRGGLIARFSDDRYLWAGLARTRAWREWHLLAKLHAMGLPVPLPVAAQVVQQGITYRADIVIESIPNTVTLAQRLRQGPLNELEWSKIAWCLYRFHTLGVYHADLNAHNILLDVQGEVYLIDFDRGRLRRPDAGWQQQNLARLQRSLKKLKGIEEEGFAFSDNDWSLLTRVYDAADGER